MFGSLLGALVLLTGSAVTPELNDQTYAQWRDHIRPRPEELSWQTVPWRSSFWTGLIEAQQQEKPILLWVMNGHPLACT